MPHTYTYIHAHTSIRAYSPRPSGGVDSYKITT